MHDVDCIPIQQMNEGGIRGVGVEPRAVNRSIIISGVCIEQRGVSSSASLCVPLSAIQTKVR